MTLKQTANTSPSAEEIQSFLPAYDSIELLATGGMGAVYRARQISLDRTVAIKVLTDSWEWVRSSEGSQRFRNIALAASRTGQPNILEVFEAGSLPDNRLYMVMEYIEGYNLYAELQEHGNLPVRRACRIVRAVARAVRAAHDASIIQSLRRYGLKTVERAAPLKRFAMRHGLAPSIDAGRLVKGEAL